MTKQQFCATAGCTLRCIYGTCSFLYYCFFVVVIGRIIKVAAGDCSKFLLWEFPSVCLSSCGVGFVSHHVTGSSFDQEELKGLKKRGTMCVN